MYQRYWGGNMDEGWTRLVLEQYGFPYQTLRDAEIKAGNLNERIDVLILPDDSTEMIIGDNAEDRLRENPSHRPNTEAVSERKPSKAIKEFVENGGTLVTLNQACNFAIEKLDLPVQNVVAGKSAKEFYCPGSTLHANIDTTSSAHLRYARRRAHLLLERSHLSVSDPRFPMRDARFSSNILREISCRVDGSSVRSRSAGTAGMISAWIWRGRGCPFWIQTAAPGANAWDVQTVFQCAYWLGLGHVSKYCLQSEFWYI